MIKNVYEDQSNQFERIVIPFTDGQKGINITTDLKEAYESEGKQIIVDFEKNISLAIIDDAWKTHLRQMDELKQSVQLATHEQKDPLLIYKFEAYNLFKTMVETMNRKTVAILMRGQIPVQEAPDEERQAAPEVRQAVPERRTDMSRYRTEKDDADAAPRSADSEGTQPQPPAVEVMGSAAISWGRSAGASWPPQPQPACSAGASAASAPWPWPPQPQPPCSAGAFLPSPPQPQPQPPPSEGTVLASTSLNI